MYCRCHIACCHRPPHLILQTWVPCLSLHVIAMLSHTQSRRTYNAWGLCHIGAFLANNFCFSSLISCCQIQHEFSQCVIPFLQSWKLSNIRVNFFSCAYVEATSQSWVSFVINYSSWVLIQSLTLQRWKQETHSTYRVGG